MPTEGEREPSTSDVPVDRFEARRFEQLNAELMEQIGDMEGYIEELESTVATLAAQLAEYEGHGA